MAEKRPVVPADLARFRLLSSVQFSPDGSRIAYVVQEADMDQNKNRSAIWLADAAGGQPRRLTNPPEGSDRAPVWSPDGTRIAFISDRSGKPQLWVINAGGGEAVRLETKERPAGEPAWSPDGTRIAFAASVFAKPEDWTPYPGAPEGDRKRAEDFAAWEPAGDKKGKEPLAVKVITRLRFRMDGVGYYGDKRSHLFVVPADGSGPAQQVTSGEFDHAWPAWSPDGQGLFCCALRREDADFHMRADIWHFGVETGEATLVYENPGPAMGLMMAPDGRHLAFAGHDLRHRGSTTTQLMLLPISGTAATGPAVSHTAALDRPVGPSGASDIRAMSMVSHQWAADGQGLYFIACDRGDSHLFHVPVTGGPPTRLTAGEDRSVAEFSVAPDGTAALVIGDGCTPDELFLLQKGTEHRLTDHNGFARELDLVRPERFTYAGADGWPMDGWVIRPVGYEEGKRYPTVLTIHGGPHGVFMSATMIQYQMLASAGIAVVYTNPRGSQGYGQEFALAVVGDWGGKDYTDIMAGVDAVIAMGIADPDRLGVTGWSYGGFMTCWTVTHTDRFKAAITGAPVANNHSMIGTTDIPWFTEWHLGGNPWSPEGEENLLAHSSIRYADRVATPTMVICGEGDLRCPISQAEEFYMALRRIGKAPAVHVRYPGEFHGFTKPLHKQDRYERTLAWFRHYLCQ